MLCQNLAAAGNHSKSHKKIQYALGTEDTNPGSQQKSQKTKDFEVHSLGSFTEEMSQICIGIGCKKYWINISSVVLFEKSYQQAFKSYNNKLEKSGLKLIILTKLSQKRLEYRKQMEKAANQYCNQRLRESAIYF